ncbi:hypothetical protein ACJMK2_043993, partial [Sinanodonta woodiana]
HHGKIPLIDCTIIEDPSSDVSGSFFEEETASLDSSIGVGSLSLQASLLPSSTVEKEKQPDYNGLDFRIVVDSKSGPIKTIILVASTYQEKAGWCSDISQCIENLHYSDLLNSSMSESSSVTMPQSVRSDPKLFRDDVDIKFSRTLNSCKVPQIRHASVDRLLDRLTDLRFLSIDFLNTFLLTYRVFTTGEKVLEALKKVYKAPEGATSGETETELITEPVQPVSSTDVLVGSPPTIFTKEPPSISKNVIKPMVDKRRVSTGCMRMEPWGEEKLHEPQQRIIKHVEFPQLERGESIDTQDSDDSRTELLIFLSPAKRAPIAICETLIDNDNELLDMPDIPAITTDDSSLADIYIYSDEFNESTDEADFDRKLAPPSVSSRGPSSPSSTLHGSCSPLTLRSVASSDTLTPGTPRVSPVTSPLGSPRRSLPTPTRSGESSPRRPSTPVKMPETYSPDSFTLSPIGSPIRVVKGAKGSSSPVRIPSPIRRSTSPVCQPTIVQCRSSSTSPKLRRAPSPIMYSYSSPNIVTQQIKSRPFSGKRGSIEAESIGTVTPRSSFTITPRSSFATQYEGSPDKARAGAVVTSSRASKRRSSSSAATNAFAIATAGATGNMGYVGDLTSVRMSRFLSAGTGATDPRLLKKRESVISTAATMRVLNVIKHWVSKHQQDFDSDPKLKQSVKEFLDEMEANPNLLPAEHKLASSVMRTITKENPDNNQFNLDELLKTPETSSKDTFDTLSALDIAEQLTYLDHKIFFSIRSEELLGQAWMKPDKATKAPHVLLVSKRFNEVSRLVVSEIISRQNIQDRVSCIEKWAAIADICRCMHNYNGVLQVCAAFVNSSVYRLKKTWEKLSKQVSKIWILYLSAR